MAENDWQDVSALFAERPAHTRYLALMDKAADEERRGNVAVATWLRNSARFIRNAIEGE